MLRCVWFRERRKPSTLFSSKRQKANGFLVKRMDNSLVLQYYHLSLTPSCALRPPDFSRLGFSRFIVNQKLSYPYTNNTFLRERKLLNSKKRPYSYIMVMKIRHLYRIKYARNVLYVCTCVIVDCGWRRPERKKEERKFGETMLILRLSTDTECCLINNKRAECSHKLGCGKRKEMYG